MRKRLILSFSMLIFIGLSSSQLVISDKGINVTGISNPLIGFDGEQSLAVNSTPVNDLISITGGNEIQIQDNFEEDTSAETECSGEEYLLGNGNCSNTSRNSQGIDEVLSENNEATNELDMSAGTLVVPTGDVY